jgi:hypothetical protein
MLRRLALIVFGIVLGAVGTYFLLRIPSHKWMPLTREGQGLAWSNDSLFNADILFPNTTPPDGKAKFVDRGLGHGNELGFLVKTKMDKLDVSKLPAKCKKTEEHNNYNLSGQVKTGHTWSLQNRP